MRPRPVAPLKAPRPALDVAVQRASPPLGLKLQALAAVVAVAFVVTAIVLGLSDRPLRALDVVRVVGQSLGVALPVCVGVYAVRREQTARFATLLVVAGLAWGPTVLALSHDSVAYSIGRICGWGVVATFVYLLLAFPVGRLTRPSDKWLASAAFVTVALLYLPTVLDAQFPTPSPWGVCTAHCPDNVLMTSDSTPPLVNAFMKIREPVSVIILAAAAFTVGSRWVRAPRVARGVHAPVFALAAVTLLVWSAFLVVRAVGWHSGAADVLAVACVLLPSALTLAFAAGLMRWRLRASRTWRQLAPAQSGTAPTPTLAGAIAEAIGDPTLEIAYWGGDDRGWIDDDGLPFAVPPAGSVRASTEVAARGEPVALLVHDDTPLVEPAIREFVLGVGVGVLALENRRIEAEARAQLRELSESRARIVAAIDRDRLRIEHDLHDGAQQRLIALKVAADRGAEAAADAPDGTVELFRRIGADATAALEEVRALARGVYPAVLVDHGLVQALGDAATRSSLRVTVSARGITRYPQEVEAAVYFCCLEALQNAEKHGRARSVAIGLVGNDAVTFEIRDDGRGFDPGAVTEGTGLMHIRDRVAAVGGHVRIESVIGGGTLIAGSVPMAPDHVPAEIERFVLRATDSLDPLTICRAIRTATGSIVDFMVEHVNDAACRAAGLTRDAQVGMTLGQLQPGYPRSELFRWHCDALAVSEPLVREDITFVGESGWRRISSATEMRAIALGAERLALLSRDITARKRAQRELEVRAEALADESAAVCVVRVTTGAIVFANRAFERMFGFAESELEGRLISDLEADVPPYTTPASGYLDNVVHLRRKDGSTLWSEVMRDGFEDSELGWCAVEVHRDVTASKQQAAEHETYRDRLSRALRGLPAVAYMTGRDLNPVLLFDSLIEPDGDPSRTGSADELFGRELGEHVAEVNRRVFVTGRPAKIEIEGGLGEPTGILTVEPVLTSTGSVAGVVGTVLQPGADGGLEKVTQPARQAGRMNVRRFGRAS